MKMTCIYWSVTTCQVGWVGAFMSDQNVKTFFFSYVKENLETVMIT